VIIGKDNPIYLEENRSLTAQASAADNIAIVCSYEDSNQRDLMSLSNLDRLIFVASFLTFMNWGTRVTYTILTNIH
jgi:hypothetical protein